MKSRQGTIWPPRTRSTIRPVASTGAPVARSEPRGRHGPITTSDLTAIAKGLFAANVDPRARGRLLRILLDGLRR
jgi:hypothetical protein